LGKGTLSVHESVSHIENMLVALENLTNIVLEKVVRLCSLVKEGKDVGGKLNLALVEDARFCDKGILQGESYGINDYTQDKRTHKDAFFSMENKITIVYQQCKETFIQYKYYLQDGGLIEGRVCESNPLMDVLQHYIYQEIEGVIDGVSIV